MKRFMALSIALVFGLSLVSAFFMTASAEAVTLRWAHAAPKRGMPVKIFDGFVKEVDQQTQGRVKIKVFWAQSLCKVMDMPECIKSGLADVGWLAHTYHPGYDELGNLMQVNNIFYDGSGVEHVKNWIKFEKQYPEYRGSFAKQKMIPIAYRYYDTNQIWSKKPIRTLDDLKGLKIRSVGKFPQAAFSAVGAVPVYISAFEMYSSLQKNIISAISINTETGALFKLHKIAGHLTMVNGAAGTGVFAMNLKKFDQLSPSDRKTLQRLGESLSLKLAKMVDDGRQAQLKKIKKDAPGFSISHVPKSELEKWRNHPKFVSFSKQWMNKAEKDGLSAKDGLEAWKAIVNDN